MVRKLKYNLFVQARTGSSRLKNKILKKICGRSLIEIFLERAKKIKKIDKIVTLLPDTEKNFTLKKILKKKKINYILGSEANVLKRFYKASTNFPSDFIIRVTSDCPIFDKKIVEKLIRIAQSKKYDYLSNVNPPTFPDGMDVEIFSSKLLKYCFLTAKNISDKEHVTPLMRRLKNIKKYNLKNKIDLSNYRLTVDYKEDLILINNIYKHFRSNKNFSYREVLRVNSKKKKKWFKINNMHKRKIV